MTHRTMTAFVLAAVLPLVGCIERERSRTVSAGEQPELREAMKDSLVHVNVSARTYEMLQPWRSPDAVEKDGFACAVGPYEVLTTALNVADAAFVRVRVHGQNEFAPAAVKVVDYECNLALLAIDPAHLVRPLVPLSFSESYRRGASVDSFFLSADGDIVTGRGHLDRAEVNRCQSSLTRFVDYVVSGQSVEDGRGSLFCMDGVPIGIACWADSEETGLIPAITISSFLRDAADGDYAGFGIPAFVTESLIDPSLRLYMGLDPGMKHGVYVCEAFDRGFAGGHLQVGDVLVEIDGRTIDAYGYYEDPLYGRISFEHHINTRRLGESAQVIVFRKGQRLVLEVPVERFKPDQMLVPYHSFDQRPEYIVTAGFVIQRLTRDYLGLWGEFSGKAPPHLYNYYRTHSFAADENRSEVVILSYVLPAEINRGYHTLGRLVIKTFNGMPIRRLADIIEAQSANLDSPYDVIEFEQESPTVVIPRAELPAANNQIAMQYGIRNLTHIRPKK